MPYARVVTFGFEAERQDNGQPVECSLAITLRGDFLNADSLRAAKDTELADIRDFVERNLHGKYRLETEHGSGTLEKRCKIIYGMFKNAHPELGAVTLSQPSLSVTYGGILF